MMQPSSEGCMNIAELANQLRREKIFINSERQLLQNLNEEVEKNVLELLQAAWICTQQRQNLTNLLTSRSEPDSIAACQRASLLERATFVDAYKVLRYKDVIAVGELLGWLKDTPHLMALCLMLGEDQLPVNLASSLISGLYGSCRFHDDRTRLLAVIRSLIKHQLAPSSDPRKLLRSNKCALAALYCAFRDSHSPARQWLVAVLQAPVMTVLQEDEFFLDIDPDKAMDRFTPSDRLKKFGAPTSPEYGAKTARYRRWAVQSLYNLTARFVVALRENWASFPAALAVILQQIVHILKQHSRITERELHHIVTDLVLGGYVCAGVASPDAHGIVDAPLSYIARANLSQVAQILQGLCLAKYQEVDPKVRDVYAKFERSCVWSLVESLYTDAHALAPPPPPAAPLRTDVRAHTAVALYTAPDAHQLVTFLRFASSKLNNNNQNGIEEQNGAGAQNPAEDCFGDAPACVSSAMGGASALAARLSAREPAYRDRLHHALRKMPDFSAVRSISEAKDTMSENGHGRRGILGKVSKPRLPRSTSADDKMAADLEPPEVLIIKLATVEEQDYLGLIGESKVLECYYGGSEAGDADDAVVPAGPPPVQKRTRFSVSHDEVSLGNTSDNLEAVSEAASNHSVTSSLELETEDHHDNLSDMVSANVSGRGSPNISGRETPSSQVTDGDAAGDAPRRVQPNAPPNQASGALHAKHLKQTRNDIEDKFCKFEIKLLEGDETISIMSDTWSTDVLASDSETIGDSCEPATPAAPPGGGALGGAPDVSETASESAWSMDVLASDSDRNTEVDTDDCVSVAARSDTSWPRRPSGHDDLPRSHQNARRPDTGSPRHASRSGMPNRSGVSVATAALARGAELDLPAMPALPYPSENRKSILVNGYPVMTCYATSAPESPSTGATLPPDLFYHQNSDNTDASSEPRAESIVAVAGEAAGEGDAEAGEGEGAEPAGAGVDATSQWVDDSFPKYDMPSTSKSYEENDLMDRSLNSSESSFNALSVSQYERRYSGEPRSAISELMTRMGAAGISSAALVNNVSRIKSEIRTSIINISSSRIEKRRDASNMSLSTLSVNSIESASDRSSSQDVNSDNVTERRVSPPPKPSTGAIPKSISFDATAEKTQRRRNIDEALAGNLDELKNNVKRSGGSLLHKIKMFRHKGRSHNQGDIKSSMEEASVEECHAEPAESSEEILAKYRSPAGDRPDRDRSDRDRPDRADRTEQEIERSEGVIDLSDPEAFNSMKRRLRAVLSNVDHNADFVPNRCTSMSLAEWVRAGAGAEGVSCGRALGVAGGAGAARLAAALRADLAARRPYASYLAACRAALLHHTHHLSAQTRNARAESTELARAAAAARTLEQLERGAALRRVARLHTQRPINAMNGGELIDEKASRLAANIKAITAEIKADPSWEGATSTVLESAELTVERAVFARLYLYILFPNGDGDIARDQVFSEHVRRLAGGASAARLGLAARHRWAAPFPHAQAVLRQLAVCRSPRDKVACVLRVVRSLSATLALSSGAPPAADDITPALVLIIIKVNPPSLLSTVELVSCLGGAALAGEALYWWTHFCAAVAHIKTMDYPADS
ncbi:receptor-mediated endocytosis protein 6 homolog isoform X2 [Aricia agestis]|uniref:receptor-mediated endocytosis protein 6 homolog isoform X2 n=1 Tax=Aricia agestis TaxID=91739 RepID=UPI001C203B3E|nr:receptor-mediated endocytosis protein 6 homolog isoform X2 [Aricia agestis]